MYIVQFTPPGGYEVDHVDDCVYRYSLSSVLPEDQSVQKRVLWTASIRMEGERKSL